MKGWGPMGRSLLFFLADMFAFWKLPNLGTVLHQHTAVGCLPGCLFSLTLPLPRFSFIIIIFYGLECEQSPSTWSIPAASGVLWRLRFESQSLSCPPGGALWGKTLGTGARLREWRSGKIQAKDASRPSVAEGALAAGMISRHGEPPSSSPVYVLTGPLWILGLAFKWSSFGLKQRLQAFCQELQLFTWWEGDETYWTCSKCAVLHYTLSFNWDKWHNMKFAILTTVKHTIQWLYLKCCLIITTI